MPTHNRNLQKCVYGPDLILEFRNEPVIEPVDLGFHMSQTLKNLRHLIILNHMPPGIYGEQCFNPDFFVQLCKRDFGPKDMFFNSKFFQPLLP